MSTETQTKIKAEFWGESDTETARIADVEIERDENDAGRVALYTFVDGRGSVTSYYLDREAALVLARNILNAVTLDNWS